MQPAMLPGLPMPVWSAFTTLPDPGAAAALAEALEALDPAPSATGVIEIEDGSETWEVAAYFTARPDPAGLALLAVMHGARDFAVSRVEDRDWVAQVRRELHPVAAGRFLVFGGHDRDRVPVNAVALEIEAAMAFGTGHHATTLGCLLALDGLVRAGFVAGRVADIGCGTGVLAMAAAKVWRKARVTASDIDPVATATARANAAANALGGRITVATAPGFVHPLVRAGGPYGLIFANILAQPLRRLAPSMARHTAPGGRLILSGILNRQADGVEAAYRANGFVRSGRRSLGDWTVLELRRP
jgi:ribosomal protein L11 methyltransferase